MVALLIVAFVLQIVYGQITLRKNQFVSASRAKIRAAEGMRPKPEEAVMTREQYLESSLAAEEECRRLYAEQSYGIEDYFSELSYLMIEAWACLFATAMGLIFSSHRKSSEVEQKAAQPSAAADRGRHDALAVRSLLRGPGG